jgi:hypothetical protein
MEPSEVDDEEEEEVVAETGSAGQSNETDCWTRAARSTTTTNDTRAQSAAALPVEVLVGQRLRLLVEHEMRPELACAAMMLERCVRARSN